MLFHTHRWTLRDFEPGDRAGFVTYQADARYRELYDLDEDPSRAEALFDMFLAWQRENPRHNLQLGIFETATRRLCGCAGLRRWPDAPDTASLGIELAPAQWGRFRLALDSVAGLVEYGFRTLHLKRIIGETASGNHRVERLGRWFGARIIAERDGPEWMRARGWREVVWALTAEEWTHPDRRIEARVRDRVTAAPGFAPGAGGHDRIAQRRP